MALFRVCLGFAILVDLLNRSEFLKEFYSDQGVLNRIAAIEHNHPARISLHLMNGSPTVMWLLFLLAMVLAVLLMIGYRTRLVTVLSWILLLSLNNRNLILQQGGDQLLTLLCFWAIFLPIGARFSIDAALRSEAQPQPPNAYFSIATVAICLQAIYVYFFGALLKTSPMWMPEGQAVYFALHAEALATPFAHWFRQYGALLQPLTFFVWTIELLAPALIFSPIWHVRLRLVALFLLINMHIGFSLFLTIGLFPLVSITSLTLFTPPEVWDWLSKRIHTPRKRAIKIYYDGDCGFCLKIAKIMRAFCLPSDVEILKAQESPDIRPIFEAEETWVVTDADGNTFIKWDGVTFVMRQSPIFWLPGVLLNLWPFKLLGDPLYRLIGNNRTGKLGSFTARFLPYRDQWLRLSWPSSVLVGILMILVFAQNFMSLPKVEYEMPEPVVNIQKSLRLQQTWNMFAPYPLASSGWFVVRGEMEDGSVVDLWHNSQGEPDTTKPKYPSQWYTDYRWRKYFERISSGQFKEQAHNFGRFYCRKYNRFEPGPQKLAALTIDYHRLTARPDHQPHDYKVIRLLNWYCLPRNSDNN